MGHGTDEAVPTVWGKAQAEPGHGAPGQAPVLKVLEPPLPHRAVKLAVEEPGSLLIQSQQTAALALPALVHPVLGDFHPRPLGQQADGIYVGQVLHIHDKGDHPAPLAAAKAVVELTVRQDMEGGGLLPMEGAQAPETSPLGGEGHVV